MNRIYLLLLLAACTSQSAQPTIDQHVVHDNLISKDLLQIPPDSALLQLTAAKRTLYDEPVLFSGIVNARRVAAIALPDAMLLFYQQYDDEWVLTDSINFHTDLFSFNDTMDLNNDGKKDLILYAYPNMHGQCEPYVFMSDAHENLQYRPDLGLYNIRYDRATGYVFSYYTESEHSKKIYSWKKDSLELVKGVSYVIESRQLTMYNKKGVYKTIDNSEAIRYDTALFDPYLY